MITVMGATGNTGSKITKLLLSGGHKVRALGRSETKLARLEQAGAEALVGDPTDPTFLTEAFTGSDAVYTLLPHDPQAAGYYAQQKALGESIVAAIESADVRYVVVLSSVGADVPAGTGVIASLHAQEQRLRKLEGTNLLILRPGSLFENFYSMLELIKHEGVIADSVAPDAKIPMIATRDIARVAAKALVDRDWQGIVVRELLGPRHLSYAEATRILGQRIEKPSLEYVQLTDDAMASALTQAGLADDFIDLHLEFNRALSDGTIRSHEDRTPENSTATHFEDFAAELAQAYQAL